ncbi:MAG: Rne/Rng family ribonuclease [Elusimicrobiota bacterium]
MEEDRKDLQEGGKVDESAALNPKDPPADDGDMNMAEALARYEPDKDGRSGKPGAPPRERGPERGRGRGGRLRRRSEHGQRQGGGDKDQRDRGRKTRAAGGAPEESGGGQGFRREIYVNTSFEETRVAIVENDRLAELLWERRDARSIVGNIYKGKVENVLPGISSAFINIGFEKNAYLYISDVLGDTRKPIDQTLKKGQEVMIQVAKEAIGTKGAKVTMDVTLPGRYLVFTPFAQFVGISKHIENQAERKRISEIVDRFLHDTLKGKGVVVRTEAEGASNEELRREANYLMRTWEAIERRFESHPAPCLLHKDLDVALQVARDLLTDEVYVYLLNSKDAYEGVIDFIGKISPGLKDRVRLYDGKTPIFTAFNIESQIEKIRQTKVSLPSGGTIVIQEAESLCAIDVNTGRFTGSKSQEETVTTTNVEAAQEVAHQLRLRNIGGIIVIDFIDMRKQSNRQKVMESLARAVKRDRAKIRILPITRLGLIEMTRERRRESTVSLMTDECPECFGSGRVLSAESMRIRIQREIYELTQGRPGGQIRLVLHPQLADAFRAKQAAIEKNVHREIRIVSDAHLQWEDYRIILE